MPSEQSDKIPCSKRTVLIMGDSTLNGIQERLMGPRFKVRAFPGGIVHDFYHKVLLLLEKKPTYVILARFVNKNIGSHSIELLQLITFIEDSLPGCKVIISNPTYSYDEPKACLTVLHLRKKLSNFETPHI